MIKETLKITFVSSQNFISKSFSFSRNTQIAKGFLLSFLGTLQYSFAPHRLVPIRRRYLFNRRDKLRLRYKCGLSMVAVFALFLTHPQDFNLVANAAHVYEEAGLDLEFDRDEPVKVLERSAPQTIQIGSASEETSIPLKVRPSQTEEKQAIQLLAKVETAAGDTPGYDEKFKDVRPDDDGSLQMSNILRSHISDGIRKASVALRKAPKPAVQAVRIKSGDTIAGALQEAGLSGNDSYEIIQALSKHYDPRKVKPGQEISLNFRPSDSIDSADEFQKMVMRVSPVKEVVVQKEGEGYKADLHEKELVQRSYALQTQIQTSLYGSAARAGIPAQVIAEVIRIYSWDVDFQRDIRQGDVIRILYNTYETDDGEFVKYGDIQYANLSVGGKPIPIYRYEMKDGRIDYFEPNGRSIRKTLMKTPVDGARISSGFGMRHHPVLGYNKMHKGMDFAAPTGTPIYAAGDGQIDYIGRRGAYGNYVRIRHNSTLKTAYAHLHKFKKGLKKGSRVQQGEVIGYIGSTGRSTGPHLHYEVLVNNAQVNPNSVDLPIGEELEGKELERFRVLKGLIDQEYVALSEGLKFAEN